MAARAVLFDLDNTLHDRDAGLETFARWQFEAMDLAAYDIDAEDWKRRFVELDAKGRVWKNEVYRTLREEFGIRQTVAELLVSYENEFSRHVQAAPGLLETLQTLRERGWRLGVVTNGRRAFQTSTLDALGIGEAIEAFVVSEECGWRKPDPEIFHHALNLLGAEAEGSWFVGDDPVADIAGAARVGLRTAWLRAAGHPGPPEATCEIAGLADLLDFTLA